MAEPTGYDIALTKSQFWTLTYERDETISFLRQPQLPVCPTQLDYTARTAL